jgi:hypothetical protein
MGQQRFFRSGGLAVALALSGLSCQSSVDPDSFRFSCSSDLECGDGYQCQPQAVGDRGLCFRVGECQDSERCNGLDDDCNGLVDEGFDLTSDDQHCGDCTIACQAGTGCRASACGETNCSNGLDDDGDQQKDCEDPECASHACSLEAATLNCGRGSSPIDGGYGGLVALDGGADAGLPADGGAEVAGLDGGGGDAGSEVDGGGAAAGFVDGGADAGLDGGAAPRGCVPRETDCSNGADDDGDGLTDCLDDDCNGKECRSGAVCAEARCPSPG